MFYGVDYYPEHWPEERWETDARLMHDAHMNIVRMAEFAWSKIEPKEGEYNFEWLDKAIEMLAKYDIKIVLGTPTAAPPKWLIDKYPDILPVDSNGFFMGFGSRRHYCPNNPHYHEYTTKIVEAMAEHYKDNSNVVAWQIDNEFGGTCYCDNCSAAFRIWLKDKYGTIENLNNSWGTVFWSQTYNDWSSVISPRRPASSPSLLLDYKRFMSDSFVKYQKMQINTIKKIIPSAKVTHNLLQFNQINYYDLSKDLDFVSWDNYPVRLSYDTTFKISNLSHVPAMFHDIARGLKKKNFWVMEQQSGAAGTNIVGRQLKPNEIRLWTYQSIAHGANAIVYFRWRTAVFGAEEYWHGILDHDGFPRRRYDEIKIIGQELKKIQNFLDDSSVDSEVALIRSFDNEWMFEIQPHAKDFKYIDQLKKYYKYFYDKNIQVDFINLYDDFNRYKIVVAPGIVMVSDEIAKYISNYVENGGIFLTTFRCGAKRWDNRMNDTSLLGPLREVFGIDIEEYGGIPANEDITVKVGSDFGKALSWYDVIHCKKAQSLGEYASEYVSGKSFFTQNCYGKGKAYYVGTIPDDKILDKMMNMVVKNANLSKNPITVVKGKVEISKRAGKSGVLYFLLNFDDEDSTVSVNVQTVDLFTGKTVSGTLNVKPMELKLLMAERS